MTVSAGTLQKAGLITYIRGKITIVKRRSLEKAACDTFEITLPPGYQVDELPPPVDADYSFASYHSKSEISGNVIRYTRTFEVRELSVPVSESENLKKFYRIIATDERNAAVLKPMAK